jgi:hypothetical protein
MEKPRKTVRKLEMSAKKHARDGDEMKDPSQKAFAECNSRPGVSPSRGHSWHRITAINTTTQDFWFAGGPAKLSHGSRRVGAVRHWSQRDGEF